MWSIKKGLYVPPPTIQTGSWLFSIDLICLAIVIAVSSVAVASKSFGLVSTFSLDRVCSIQSNLNISLPVLLGGSSAKS